MRGSPPLACRCRAPPRRYGHPQHLAAQARQVLRQRPVVVVAGRDVQVAVGAEADAAAAVGTRAAVGVAYMFEGDVGDDVGAV